MSEKNPERHYYLYAKGHYKVALFENDLKKIQSHYCAVDAEDLTMKDVNRILQNLAWGHIKAGHKFNKFMDYLRLQHPDESFEKMVARARLTILSLTKVKEISFPLDKADPNVLPLAVRS